ncbi:MAG TPA: sialidase family protein [Armatimonadota bacterium]|nr:sialidase family protein [Armatimonadota bacterium]
MLRLLLALGCVMAVHLGFTSLVATSNKEFPRHSEGSIVELKDGRLLLAWTRFYGGSGDAASANIAAMTSKDGGRTWSKPYVIQENTGKQNVMSVSLLRLKSGKIGMYYLEKNADDDLRVYQRYSSDEAKTWTAPDQVTFEPGYSIMNNDRVVQLSTGRILCPISYTPDIGAQGWELVCFCLYSDDQGKTWHRSVPDLHAPQRGAMEPGVAELANGDLLMIIRTQVGCIYESISKNKGMTWSQPVPTTIKSPSAPATIKRIPGSKDLLLVWDNNYEPEHGGFGKRTPLTAAISKDNGKTWEHVKNIETEPDHGYAYTSILFVKKSVLMTYYEQIPGKPGWSLRFRSVPLRWFYGD